MSSQTYSHYAISHVADILNILLIDSYFRLQELSTNGNVAQNKSVDQLEKIEDIVKLEKVVSELEKDCEKFQKERDAAKEKLAAHDVAAKRAITALQKEMTLRVDQVRNYLCFTFFRCLFLETCIQLIFHLMFNVFFKIFYYFSIMK